MIWSIGGRVVHQLVRVVAGERLLAHPARCGSGLAVATGRAGLGLGQISSILVVQPGGGVDVLPVGATVADLEVQMRAGRHPGAADIGDAAVTRSPAVTWMPSSRSARTRGHRGPSDGVFDDDQAADLL